MAEAAVSGKRQFDKKALTIVEQLDLLKNRDLLVVDEERAKSYLQTIGYYRLSAYFKPYQIPGYVPLSEGGVEHPFQAGSTFKDVLHLYVMDRKLRLLMVDALERIEVAVRALISNTMCVRQDDPFWFAEERFFNRKYLNNIVDANGRTGYQIFIKQVGFLAKKSKNEACQHYRENYDHPKYPPCWLIIELLTMGVWSRLYEGLSKSHQRAITDLIPFEAADFGTWVNELTDYRNACAHHERFWNRTFKRKAKDVGKYTYSGAQKNTPYSKYVITYAFLKLINEKSQWPIRLKALMDEWPLDIHTHMGFPKDWHTLPFWQVPPK